MGKAKDWGWKRDPLVHREGKPGAPPEGHVRRCQAKVRHEHRQCGRWALKGRNYCKLHGGQQPLYEVGYYSRNAGKRLADKLDALASMDPDERNSLTEEIDLNRLLAERALKAFEATHYGDKEVSEKLKALAAQNLRDALQDVTEVVAKSAIIRSRSAEVVGIEDLGFIIHQIKKILDEEDVDPRVIDRLDEIKLPKRGSEMGQDEILETLGQLRDSVG